MRKTLLAVAASATLLTAAFTAFANCDPGEVVIKFSHVTNTDRHPRASPPRCWRSASTRR